MSGALSAKPARQPSSEQSCRATFAGRDRDRKLADLIEQDHPACACEKFSVSEFSPGPLGHAEIVHRIIVSPRDIDQNGTLKAAPFEKVAEQGLSVARALSTAEQLEALVVDGMYSNEGQPLRSVEAVFGAAVADIRAFVDAKGERLFGVYDQTVPRPLQTNEHVPAHAGIFLRLPPPGTVDRKKFQKDYAGMLRDLFITNDVPIGTIHNGLLEDINQRAAGGEFVKSVDN